MKKTVIAVVGRTGAGKDVLTRKIADVCNIPIVCSYTDRPMRPTETNGVEHFFLSEKEMDELACNESRLFAYTKIGETGYRYCITKDYIDSLPGNTVFYVIDPDGIDYLKTHNTEYDLKIINVRASYINRKERAVKRNGESSAFEKRVGDEKTEFDLFESNEDNYDYVIHNDSTFENALNQFEEIIAAISKSEKENERGVE